jgi:hypothetical protein
LLPLITAAEIFGVGEDVPLLAALKKRLAEWGNGP